jgi:hypothetical protein
MNSGSQCDDNDNRPRFRRDIGRIGVLPFITSHETQQAALQVNSIGGTVEDVGNSILGIGCSLGRKR